MKIIKARAPLRLGLAGGGTDVSPYADTYGGYILNATIDRYAYAVIETSEKNTLSFYSNDQQEEFISDPIWPLKLDGKLNLLKAVYNHMVEHYNHSKPLSIKLTTHCDAPAGSGLGTSSTLVVSIISAFAKLLNVSLDEYAIAHMAFKIERIDCGLGGGRQDQYSATFGGFNFMEFYENERVIINSLKIKSSTICELESSLVLFFTGLSRDSAAIISDQSKNVSSGLTEAIEAMHGIKNEAMSMKESLLKADFNAFVESMKFGWESKKKSAKSISNPYMDEIYNEAINAGAQAGKVSGAGGGGFMLFFVPTNKRMDLIRKLNKFNGQVSNCHFTDVGAQAWESK
jgi:D-glycero-alpha-D-manno-heptose-7-phosphate kinase